MWDTFRGFSAVLNKTFRDHHPAEGVHLSVRYCGNVMIDIATFCRGKKKIPNKNLMVALEKKLATKKVSMETINVYCFSGQSHYCEGIPVQTEKGAQTANRQMHP